MAKIKIQNWRDLDGDDRQSKNLCGTTGREKERENWNSTGSSESAVKKEP